MFYFKIPRNRFIFCKRQFAALVQESPVINQDPVSNIKTVLDKNKVIKRVSETGTVWESVIGIEVHAQIAANSKLFSSAPHDYCSPVNSNVTYFDASIPGTLPVLNRRCVEAGVKTALVLGCHVNQVSYFDRKHYFYADLPAGYQITQQRQALAVSGVLRYPVLCQELSKAMYSRECEVTQVQLEQDSGKSLHDEEEARSLVDLNRCGVGLMEIVFGPQLRHGEEAAALVKELLLILETLDSSKARMERGELRVDANVSVRRWGEQGLGVRTEVKNLNSVRSVVRAIEHEVARQIQVLESGGQVENETRSFDYNTKVTVPMRDKEAKLDYRFMPEPNLPPLRLSDDVNSDSNLVNIAQLRSEIPELPAQTRHRLTEQYHLSDMAAAQLVSWPSLLTYFTQCVQHQPHSYKQIVDLIFSVVQHQCVLHNIEPSQTNLRPQTLVEASNLRQEKVISASGLQEVLSMVMTGDKRSVEDIVKEENLYLIRDQAYIDQFIDDMIRDNKQTIDKYQKETNPKKVARIYQSLINIVNKDSRVDKVDMVMFIEKFKQRLDHK